MVWRTNNFKQVTKGVKSVRAIWNVYCVSGSPVIPNPEDVNLSRNSKTNLLFHCTKGNTEMITCFARVTVNVDFRNWVLHVYFGKSLPVNKLCFSKTVLLIRLVVILCQTPFPWREETLLWNKLAFLVSSWVTFTFEKKEEF